MRLRRLITIGAFLAASAFFGMAYYSYAELQSFYTVFEHYGISYEIAVENADFATTEWNFKIGIARFLVAGTVSLIIGLFLLYRAFRPNE
jgi:hypothetical protein